jgi:cysteinyl-tRNA synthetase
VFPHHENEAAQTAAARGRPLARAWMHNGMLEAAAGEKMAKSVGNIRGLADVLDDVGGTALVLFFSTGHYRQPLAYSAEGLEAAAASARRIRDAARRVGDGDSPAPGQAEAFWEALADDYNTPRALAALYEWIGEANKLDEPGGRKELGEMLQVLGLESLLEADEAPAEMVALAEQREAARRDKDWAEADRLRDALRDAGWEVRDGPQGPELVKAS